MTMSLMPYSGLWHWFWICMLKNEIKKGKKITGLKSIQWKDHAPPTLSSNLPLKSMKVSLCLLGTSYRVHMNHTVISALTVWVKPRAIIITKGAGRDYWLWKKGANIGTKEDLFLLKLARKGSWTMSWNKWRFHWELYNSIRLLQELKVLVLGVVGTASEYRVLRRMEKLKCLDILGCITTCTSASSS